MNNPENKNYEPHPEEAWSWIAAEIPYRIERIRKVNGVTYYYFRDDRGDLWYQTDRGIQFALEIEAAGKRQKK